MNNYFRNIISTEYDQDPAFVRLVRIVLGVSTALITILDVAYALKTGSPNVRIAAAVIGSVALLSAISFFLTFHNILWPGKTLFPLMFLSAVIFTAIVANGTHDTAMMGFPVVIIVATLLAGKRVIPLATVLAVLGVLIVTYADIKGITNNVIPNSDYTDDIVAFIILLFITAATLNELMTRLNSALDTSRANEQAQIKSNQELRQLQASLEQRVADRTRDLSIASDELRRSDLMKNQFLSSVSHELRTPLNAIINFVEMVALGLVGPVTEEQKELLNNSLKSSTHLLQLINDILDISKIQAGKLTLFIEQDVDLYSVLNTAIDTVQPMFNEKQVELIQDIDNNLPLISGDKRRIHQVLLNLLSNAIKFTNEGTVTLSVKLEDTEVMFAVIDTGIGIALDAQSAIFEPFVQTADGIKMEQGTGLGLPISRSLVQAHGGELWMESQPGEGSAFYFNLPICEKHK